MIVGGWIEYVRLGDGLYTLQLHVSSVGHKKVIMIITIAMPYRIFTLLSVCACMSTARKRAPNNEVHLINK